MDSTVIVVVVPVEFFFKALLQGDVNLNGGVCISNQTGTVALVPDAAVVVDAGADIDVVVAKAGVQLSGTIMKTFFIPQLTLTVGSAGNVHACFNCSILLQPLTVSFQGFYQTFTCFTMVQACALGVCIDVPLPGWCDQQTIDIYTYTMDSIVIPLFGFCFGPVDPPAPPTPTSSIAPVQAGYDLSVSWQPCQAQSVISNYTVCVETSAGAADVLPCTDVATATHYEADGVLQGLPHGQVVFARVGCITVDGSSSENVSAPLALDLDPPVVQQLAITRVNTSVDGLPSVSSDPSAALSFVVVPGLSCVSTVKVRTSGGVGGFRGSCAHCVAS